MTSVIIYMPEPMKEFLNEQVANSSFESAGQYIRALFEEAQNKSADERLQALFLQGLASGPSIPVKLEFWQQMRHETDALLAGHQASSEARKSA